MNDTLRRLGDAWDALPTGSPSLNDVRREGLDLRRRRRLRNAGAALGAGAAVVVLAVVTALLVRPGTTHVPPADPPGSGGYRTVGVTIGPTTVTFEVPAAWRARWDDCPTARATCATVLDVGGLRIARLASVPVEHEPVTALGGGVDLTHDATSGTLVGAAPLATLVAYRVTIDADPGVVQHVWDSAGVAPPGQRAVPTPQSSNASGYAEQLDDVRFHVYGAPSCPGAADCVAPLTTVSPEPGTVVPGGSTVTLNDGGSGVSTFGRWRLVAATVDGDHVVLPDDARVTLVDVPRFRQAISGCEVVSFVAVASGHHVRLQVHDGSMLTCMIGGTDPLRGRYGQLLRRVDRGTSGPDSLVLTGPGVRLAYRVLTRR